jgi:hypothetical protein
MVVKDSEAEQRVQKIQRGTEGAEDKERDRGCRRFIAGQIEQ